MSVLALVNYNSRSFLSMTLYAISWYWPRQESGIKWFSRVMCKTEMKKRIPTASASKNDFMSNFYQISS